MTDSVTIGGEELISSKRASKETGYTQDYIGQLARGGALVAKRIGGHWYVSLPSLRAYKLKADEYKPQPPAYLGGSQEVETSISFDGRDFVSASHAAKLTGYHQDYVGQLARSGKVASRQIGNRWFVDRDALLSHKSEKDSLLAAVQMESVGLPTPSDLNTRMDAATSSTSGDVEIAHEAAREPFFSYSLQAADLMPVVVRGTPSLPPMSSGRARSYSGRAEFHYPHDTPKSLPIRHLAPSSPLPPGQRYASRPRSRKRVLLPLSGAALTIVVILSFGFTSLREQALYALGQLQEGTRAQIASPAAIGTTLRQVIDRIEEIFSHELHYTAPRK